MNVKLLRKVQKFILEEPRRFNMSSWIVPLDDWLDDRPPCGTALCIAGAVYAIGKNLRLNRTSVVGDLVEAFASDHLDLNQEESRRLFFAGNWPLRFNRMYYYGRTPLDRAKVGVERIDYFIKTKGTDDDKFISNTKRGGSVKKSKPKPKPKKEKKGKD